MVTSLMISCSHLKKLVMVMERLRSVQHNISRMSRCVMIYSDAQKKEIFNKNPGSCYICLRTTVLWKHGDPYLISQSIDFY